MVGGKNFKFALTFPECGSSSSSAATHPVALKYLSLFVIGYGSDESRNRHLMMQPWHFVWFVDSMRFDTRTPLNRKSLVVKVELQFFAARFVVDLQLQLHRDLKYISTNPKFSLWMKNATIWCSPALRVVKKVSTILNWPLISLSAFYIYVFATLEANWKHEVLI